MDSGQWVEDVTDETEPNIGSQGLTSVLLKMTKEI